MLSRDQILGAQDLERRSVDVPEWGGVVCVRLMTGSERDRFEAEHLKAPQVDARARMAAATLCDEQGALLFTADDVAALGKKSATALNRVVEVAFELNRVGKADVDAAEKNS